MGGDFGPEVNVPGSLAAARETGAAIVLVGDEAAIRQELERHPHADVTVDVVHTTQVAGMAEKPSDILRRKKDSSIQVAFRLVRDGQAHGVVTAGNSGAALACGMFILGRIAGVDRPALATILPTLKKPIVLIDVGANADCKPYNLVQFRNIETKYLKYGEGPAVPYGGPFSESCLKASSRRIVPFWHGHRDWSRMKFGQESSIETS